LLAPLSPNPSLINKRHVLTQLSHDPADEHFPLLIYNGEVFGDFTITTRFKCVRGDKEQMAGIAFRIQDEKNYYVIRASALGNSFRFYKFVAGERSAPIGPEVKIPTGTWHEMTVSCKGSEIRSSLDGKELIPALTDHSFIAGKIGFWTKSDSISSFAETRIEYTPREPLAQKVLRDLMTMYPRIIGLRMYAVKEEKLQVIASTDEKEIGDAGTDVEENVIKKANVYCAKGRTTVAVIVPVRDRNGDSVAALRVTLKAFPGQTENNAIARAMPINKEISLRLQSAKSILE
jgi:hypothetical protein